MAGMPDQGGFCGIETTSGRTVAPAVLLVAEQEFGQALSRIFLDDMVQRAVLNGHENINSEPRSVQSP